MTPLLKVCGISLSKGKKILQDISFEVGEGEILMVLGPSGSGKTSLLRCLNRLETIESGEIFFHGRETRVLPVADLRRQLGMVFQAPALLPITVEENLQVGPRLQNKEMEAGEIQSLMERVGLEKIFLNGRWNRSLWENSNGSPWRRRWPTVLRCYCLTSRHRPSIQRRF